MKRVSPNRSALVTGRIGRAFFFCLGAASASLAQTGFTESTQVLNATASGTATAFNQLACWNGSAGASAAINCQTGATNNYIGLVVGNPGTAGSADIVTSGPTQCLFDATTPAANDYIVSSNATAGLCSDAGSTYPTTQLPLGIVTASGSPSAVTSVFLFRRFTGPGALYLNTAPSTSGNSGNIVVDPGAVSGSATAGQVQIGSTNAASIAIGGGAANVAIGGSSGTSGLVGIGGANTSANGDILQVKAPSSLGYSAIEFTYTNSGNGYGNFDFYDTTTPSYEWSFGAASPAYVDTKLNGPKFYIEHLTSTTYSYPFVVDASGHIGIGPQNPSAFLDVSGPLSAAPSATVGTYLNFAASTLTDNATAPSGTAPGATFNAIQVPTLAAANTSVTTTNAYTLQLLGGPLAGTNDALTNSTALSIASNALVRTTNGFGLQVHAPSGATNNYAAAFLGGNVGIGAGTPLTALDVRQPSNGTGTIYSRRATDTTPTGNFVQFQNNAGTATAFSVDVNGNMALGGSASLQGGLILKRVATGPSSYNISSSDYLVAFTSISSGGTAAYLPNTSAVATGQMYIIKDESGTASPTNAITVYPASGSGQTIDTVSSVAITSASAYRRVYSDGTNWHQW